MTPFIAVGLLLLGMSKARAQEPVSVEGGAPAAAPVSAAGPVSEAGPAPGVGGHRQSPSAGARKASKRRRRTAPAPIRRAVPSREEPSPAARFQARLGPLVEAYNAGDYEAVGRDFSPAMAKSFPKAKRASFFSDLNALRGRILSLKEPRLEAGNLAVTPAVFDRGVLDIKLALDKEGRISGLWFLPRGPNLPIPDRNQTELGFPLKGWWTVLWGGSTDKQNRHRPDPSQRFALDLVMRVEAGRGYRTDGAKNEDYPAYGREVLSPADGYVVEAIDGVHDNIPGTMNPYSALGNAVLIRHSEREVSVLAHLQQGSVPVKRGDRVAWGDVVGKVGNSGNSSEPHLHYHLQNAERLEEATGIRCFFSSVLASSSEGPPQKLKDLSPVQGDVLSRP